jgi:hypothetical protein
MVSAFRCHPISVAIQFSVVPPCRRNPMHHSDSKHLPPAVVQCSIRCAFRFNSVHSSMFFTLDRIWFQPFVAIQFPSQFSSVSCPRVAVTPCTIQIASTCQQRCAVFHSVCLSIQPSLQFVSVLPFNFAFDRSSFQLVVASIFRNSSFVHALHSTSLLSGYGFSLALPPNFRRNSVQCRSVQSSSAIQFNSPGLPSNFLGFPFHFPSRQRGCVS